jgi:cytochrome c2
MVDRWSEWRSFPACHRGELLNAPVGPGLYELRHRHTGELLGFGHAANVAAALTHHFSPNLWSRLLHKPAPEHHNHVEYRTMSASSLRHARDQAAAIAWRRNAFWSRAA